MATELAGVYCPTCGDTFDTETGMKVHYGQVHDGSLSFQTVTCANCGDAYEERGFKVERAENNFCSTDCHDEWRSEHVSGPDAGGWDGGKVTFECYTCGDESEKWPSRVEYQERNFCSDACWIEWMSNQRNDEIDFDYPTGEDHHEWSGGQQDFRLTDRWQRFRKSVYSRDNYTCQNCGATDTEVHAHHIVPVSEGGAKFDMDNLKTLCAECHYAVHSNSGE